VPTDLIESKNQDSSGIRESIHVIRKKILLHLLAKHEAERLGITISTSEVQDVVDEFRLRHGLLRPEDVKQWLESARLTTEEFISLMYEFAVTNSIEQVYDSEISKRVPIQLQIAAARERASHDFLPIVDSTETSSWLQVNVAVARHNASALPGVRALFRRLSPIISYWKREQKIKCFFFARKPPDLRLRFLCASPESELLLDLETILLELQKSGLVSHFFRSVYEPEVLQFGGTEAMALVHRYFETDSLAWTALDLLEEANARIIATDTLVLAVMNDLFLRTLSCSAEVWDAWCNLAKSIPSSQTDTPPRTEIVLIESIVPSACAEEERILRNYLEANQQLATGLQHTWTEGKLLCGMRALLPFIAMFHFNRHGLDSVRQVAIASAMKQAWNPKQGLRGTEVSPPRITS
jgi:thiopeptide-type bacteriocin biosynthesis protein